MKLSEFDYALPKELIAQYPAKRRGDDRLLVVDRKKKNFSEKRFADIAHYFQKGDTLVLNDTKVIPARIFGKRKTGGKVEIFVLDAAKNPAEALVRPSGRIKEGEVVTLDSGRMATVLERSEIGRFVEFEGGTADAIKECGHMPLPPYISRPDEPEDSRRYQTVYARSEGATASPTAGLHFTEDALEALRQKGVGISYITLHVSYGTFAPVKEEEVEKHRMHSEFYRISKNNVIMLSNALMKKAKIFACGTTSLRALEACVERINKPDGIEGATSLFIYPGYVFKIAGGLITNFHLPKSTLLLLTSAFCGRELIFKVYDYAIKNKFRFFSYGDAMLII